ncbi:MAG: hypothetical protein QG552_2040, partial [Thermodesulfobacteriota bacterium]|nr:hypothetical protein [Thermodesulfobacteriota bacterium]
MGLLKIFSRELPKKPWIPIGKDSLKSPGETPGKEAVQKKILRFCDPSSQKPCITVCRPRAGCECGSGDLREALLEGIKRLHLNIEVGDAKTGCTGRCKAGPFIGFPQKGFFYLGVRPQDAPDILYETIIHGRILFPFLSLNPERSYRADIYYEKDSGFLAAIDDKV